MSILRTDLALRGIPATAGKHLIRMTYQPAAVRKGLFASLAAPLAFTSWLLGRFVIRARQPNTQL